MAKFKAYNIANGFAYFMFYQQGDETSHLAVDSRKQLYVCHTNGEDITSKIPLGKATPENVKRLSDCLQQLQKLVAPAPKR